MGRVVDQHDVLHGPPHDGEVLDVVALVQDARLAEEAVPDEVFGVHEVEEGVRVLAEARGEDDDLKVGRDGLQEVVAPRPLDHVDVDDLPVYLDGDDVVGVVYGLEARVHEGLVEVEHEGLLAAVLVELGREHDVAIVWRLPDARKGEVESRSRRRDAKVVVAGDEAAEKAPHFSSPCVAALLVHGRH